MKNTFYNNNTKIFVFCQCFFTLRAFKQQKTA
nr:MAG TPA: hypothetical protein [Caudoviricetes sp.]